VVDPAVGSCFLIGKPCLLAGFLFYHKPCPFGRAFLYTNKGEIMKIIVAAIITGLPFYKEEYDSKH